MRHCITLSLVVLGMSVTTGCSSLGLTLWPSQLPLLDKAKEFAARSTVPSGLEHELSKQALPDYYIEPGDRLLIEPVELDSDFRAPGDQEVKVDGSVDLGRYGRLRVSGLTIEQIEAAIHDHIQNISGKDESINVQLLASNAAQVYVLGAVEAPGAFSLAGHETVLDVILKAGGLTSKASPCDIILVRPTDDCECRVVQRVCYRQITQLGDVTTNYQIQPGDRVVVGERSFCQELAFWKQSEECPCCDRSRCSERNPQSKDYRNRFVNWIAPLPLPLFKKTGDQKTDNQKAATEQNKKGSGNDTPSAQEPNPTPSPNLPAPLNDRSTDDKDIFLPPELPKSGDALGNSYPSTDSFNNSFSGYSSRNR